MSRKGRRLLFAMLAAGALGRLILAFSTYGLGVDMDALQLVREALADDPLHLYGALNFPLPFENFDQGYRWPYPPGFFSWIHLSGAISANTGLPFHGLVQIPSILADLGIALLAQDMLGRRGAEARTRLAGAGLIALGPSFILISGYHGQIDSVAILPAVGALYVWERSDWWGSHGPMARGLAAGLLIGVGGVVKTAPLLMVAALLPSAKSMKERVALVGGAAVPCVILFLPFVLADLDGVRGALGYQGHPGLGGLSLALQPALAEGWLAGNSLGLEFSSLTELLYRNGGIIFAGLMFVLTILLVWRREPAVSASVILWLTVYVLGPAFAFQYLVWGLPFLIIAGFVRAAAAIQVVSIVPAILLYTAAGPDVVVIYVVLMLALWVGWIVGLGSMVARPPVGRSRSTQPA